MIHTRSSSSRHTSTKVVAGAERPEVVGRAVGRLFELGMLGDYFLKLVNTYIGWPGKRAFHAPSSFGPPLSVRPCGMRCSIAVRSP
jgi:hypothetical protein